jgi:hypothetical protein
MELKEKAELDTFKMANGGFETQMASINDAAVDCGEVFDRFYTNYRLKNGVNTEILTSDRAKAVNGQVGEDYPSPGGQA